MSRVGLDQVFGYGIKFDHPMLGNLLASHFLRLTFGPGGRAGWVGMIADLYPIRSQAPRMM